MRNITLHIYTRAMWFYLHLFALRRICYVTLTFLLLPSCYDVSSHKTNVFDHKMINAMWEEDHENGLTMPARLL